MMQQTSLLAYKEIHNIVTTRQSEVLMAFSLSCTNSLTNMELAGILGWSINRVTPRVLELRRIGYLELKDKRPCDKTGRMAMAWGLIE